MERETRRFVASGTDGERYTIIEVTSFINVSLEMEPPQWRPGQPRLLTIDGREVSPTGDGQFMIVESGVKVRRD